MHDEKDFSLDALLKQIIQIRENSLTMNFYGPFGGVCDEFYDPVDRHVCNCQYGK